MNEFDQEILHSIKNDLDDLILELDEVTKEHSEEIGKVSPTHFVGARNLMHYAHLRTKDLRDLQQRLSSVGATRLTTTEPAVQARLKAARNVIGAFAGEGPLYPPSDVVSAFEDADEILDEHAEVLLGDPLPDTPSCIMVTLPAEAATDIELVRGFAKSGMDLARINCAHDDETVWKQMIDNVHTVAEEVGREIRVSMDLAGPKVRTGAIAPGPEVGRARVTRSETGKVLTRAKLWITARGAEHIPVPENLPGRPALAIEVDPNWFANLQVGSVIRFPDTRGARRSFTVTRAFDGAMLAEGDQKAYVSNGTLLEHDYDRTRVFGIPAIVQRINLKVGDRLILTDEEITYDPSSGSGRVPRISCTLPQAVRAIKVGHRVLFDDGAIAAVCIDKTEAGEFVNVELEVTRARPQGVNLAAYKGINLPDSDLPLPSLTEEDLQHLRFVAKYADIAAISFIRDVADVEYVLQALEDIGDPVATERLGLVLKIETIPGYEGLAHILLTGMRHENFGIMIARGDLAVELGFDRMAEVPQLIMALAEAAHVPTILATQVLENMAKNGLPSRAEITDAAMALRAECVMLNKGPHINDAIKVLTQMSKKLGASQRKSRLLLRKVRSWEE
ncbi:pyruvate kinase [Corynebacterium deserti GIMN1.010]|uniref:pyruvate kinase n=1 Tax=Corynebacterium deserti GIMN1.010 TaxID=931089 RepID=A0A0M4CI61_9CORY|nr:pyruvate kinase [Corynebacterium deserti]ALC06977.1 pyruvate kinase [Corynebacterium deserti GIMN1.010]